MLPDVQCPENRCFPFRPTCWFYVGKFIWSCSSVMCTSEISHPCCICTSAQSPFLNVPKPRQSRTAILESWDSAPLHSQAEKPALETRFEKRTAGTGWPCGGGSESRPASHGAEPQARTTAWRLPDAAFDVLPNDSDKSILESHRELQDRSFWEEFCYHREKNTGV